jgi:hypothetical protein
VLHVLQVLQLVVQVLQLVVQVLQVSQQLLWKRPFILANQPQPESQQVSQPPYVPPQLPPLHPCADETTAGGAAMGAGAGVWPANQAEVTNRNAAFTWIPPFGVKSGSGWLPPGRVRPDQLLCRFACAGISTVTRTCLQFRVLGGHGSAFLRCLISARALARL